MAKTEAQKRADKKYKESNYEFFNLRLIKGEKEKLKTAADAENKSINQYIRDIIFK